MKKRNNNRPSLPLTGIIACLLALTGCSQGKNAPTPSIDQVGEFTRRISAGKFGTAEHFQINSDALKEKTTTAKAVRLTPLEVGQSSKNAVFALGQPGIRPTIVVTPRLLFRSSLTAERTVLRTEKEESIVVLGHIALVDGLQSELTTGTGVYRIPQSYLATKPKTLIAELSRLLGTPPQFASKYPCPNSVIFRFLGRSVEVPLRNRLETCQTNTFLPVELEFGTGDWRDILSTFIGDESVELEISVNLALPVRVEYAQLNISPNSLAAEILKQFPEGKAHSRETVLAAAAHLFKEVTEAFGLRGGFSGASTFQTFVMRSYFYEVPCTQGEAPSKSCYEFHEKPLGGSKFFDLRLEKHELLSDPLEIKIQTPLAEVISQKQELFLKADSEGLLVRPAAGTINNSLRSVQEGEILEVQINRHATTRVGFESPKVTTVPNMVCTEPFSLCHDGKWTCTNTAVEKFNERSICTDSREECLKTCFNPAILEPPIRFKECYYPKLKHRFQGENSKSTAGCECKEVPPGHPLRACRLDELCKSQEICFKRGQVCYANKLVYDERPVCDALPYPAPLKLPFRLADGLPSIPNFKWDCTRSSENECAPDKWQDQWQRITTYSHPFLNRGHADTNIDQATLRNFIEGVSVNFTWAPINNVSTEVTCHLADMDYRILRNNRLIITFQNTSKCRVFNEENRRSGRAPNLAFINQITMEETFQCGTLWENWLGKRKYTCRLPDAKIIEKETSASDDDAELKNGSTPGIFIPYFPRVSVQATLRVVGSYFESLGETK